MNDVATIITFEDHGQDFLRWSLDSKGKVIDCQPFQASVWCERTRVTNHRSIKPGDVVHIKQLWRSGEETRTTMNYRAVGVKRIGGAA